MHVIVATCAHRGDDARIVHRQARVLLQAGHSVTLIAPDCGDDARRSDPPGLVRVSVKRAVGRRRLGAWRQVRRALRSVVRQHGDERPVILVHDPELVAVVGWGRGAWRRAVLIWDVHEDFLASVAKRSWIPSPARPIVSATVRLVERAARRRFHLLLAEDAYAQRLGTASVVPNSTWIPDRIAPCDDPPRLVYVGRVSTGRGLDEMIAVGRELRARHAGVEVRLIGAADHDVEERLEAAHRSGDVMWLGPRPNPEAMNHVQGALAGLSLLHDEANYRHSRPTKCVEYLAHGVPVITTPLPLAEALVNVSNGGAVTSSFTPHEVVDQVIHTVLAWQADAVLRAELGAQGHAHVVLHHSWQADGARFVELLEDYWSSPAA